MTIETIHLLGDSIFDNSRYVETKYDAVSSLLASIVADKRVNVALDAVDGYVTHDVVNQLTQERSEPYANTAAAVLSVGGNDALGVAGILMAQVSNVHEALTLLRSITEEFRGFYTNVLDTVTAYYNEYNIRVCTIYNKIPVHKSGHLPIEAMTALALFNDVITEEAAKRDLPVIDLRMICDQESDYSEVSPIEPSRSGGKKIAYAIAKSFDLI